MPVEPTPDPMADRAAESNAAYRDIITQGAPKMEDYRPSKKRTFAAALLGGFAGLGNAQAGIQTARGIVEQPYNAAMSDYQRQLSNAGSLANFDETSLTNVSRRAQLGAQTEAEVSRKKAQEALAGYHNRRTVKWEPTSKDEALQMVQAQHPQAQLKPEYFTLELEGGGTVDATIDHKTGQWMAGQTPVTGKIVKRHKLGEKDPAPHFDSEFDQIRKAKEDELKRKLTSTEMANLRTHPPDPTTEALKQSVLMMNKLKINEMQNAGTDDATQIAAFAHSPDDFHNLPAKDKSRLQRQMAAQGIPVPVKVGADTQNRERAANQTLQHVVALKQMVKDPMIRKWLGPVSGRIANAMTTGGFVVPGMSPQEAQKVEEFRDRLVTLSMQEAANINPRFSQQVKESISKASPQLLRNIDLFEGDLNAAERLAGQAMDVAWQSRWPQGQAPPRPGTQPKKTGNGILDALNEIKAQKGKK
jgi:hypothetical protein